MSRIVTPGRAEDTGLVPKGDGCKVIKDKPEGEVDLDKLDYSSGPVRDSEKDVNGWTMISRARKDKNVLGSLGFAFYLKKAQDEGKEIFPVESRGRHRFLMPLTELRDDYNYRLVAYFRWSDYERRWVLRFHFFFCWLYFWFEDDFDHRDRFVRRGE